MELPADLPVCISLGKHIADQAESIIIQAVKVIPDKPATGGFGLEKHSL